MTIPRVSVILPVYNAEAFVLQAVNSLLQQTYSDFEIIAIDDGSSDHTLVSLRKIVDPRLHVYTQTNQGITKTLNRALTLAQGEYMARMDADDICHHDRLRRQVEYLDSHPEIGLLGTSYRTIDRNGQVTGIRNQLAFPKDIRRQFYMGNPFCHPTVMFRRCLLDEVGVYDETAVSEDYEMWLRLSLVTEVANLEDVLLDYRVGLSTNLTTVKHDALIDYRAGLISRLWERAMPPPLWEDGQSLRGNLRALWRTSIRLGRNQRIQNGTGNRSRPQLFTSAGIHIIRRLYQQGDRRAAWREWLGLLIINFRFPIQVMRLLKYTPIANEFGAKRV